MTDEELIPWGNDQDIQRILDGEVIQIMLSNTKKSMPDDGRSTINWAAVDDDLIYKLKE
jgi:hypothetical protein